MIGQMTIFDVLNPHQLNPLREVARKATPYWKTSRNKIIKADKSDIYAFSNVVKNEYCPYEGAGSCGRSIKQMNELDGWDFKRGRIIVVYYDETGKRQTGKYLWVNLAREIAELIARGEYNPPEEEIEGE